MSEQPGFRHLGNPLLPPDRGLSSLALLMQLTGGLFAAWAGMMALLILLAPTESSEATLAVVLGMMAAVRSAVHWYAGRSMLVARERPLKAAMYYLLVAAIQTIATVAILGLKLDSSLRAMVAAGMFLGSWPVAIGVILFRPGAPRFETRLPIADDAGIESLGVLMFIMGLGGVVMCAFMSWFLFQVPGFSVANSVGATMVALLLVGWMRSTLHFAAGVKGIRGCDFETVAGAARGYSSIGIATAICVSVLVLLQAPLGIASVSVSFTFGACLLVWPLVVRGFIRDRRARLAQEITTSGREPERSADLGLTALGWVLLASALWSLAGSTFSANSSGLPGLSTSQELPIWRSLLQTGLYLWSAQQLLTMGRWHRVTANVTSVVTIAMVVFCDWQNIKQIMSQSVGLLGGQSQFGDFLMLSVACLVPVATLFLVNREKLTSAVARIRKPASVA